MKNRIALVTGGTRGIGLGIARALARDGWDLAIVGVRPDADVQVVVDELRQHVADDIVTIAPCPRSFIPGRNALIVRNVETSSSPIAPLMPRVSIRS